MKRIIVMVLKNILFVPYYWIMLNWYAAHVDRYTEEERYKLLQQVDHRAIRGGNLIIDAHGVENIPKKNGFMFFPNHQGLFDVLAIIQVCPVPFSVVAKKELTDVPFLKQVFACMKAFMIDREDVKQSMQVIIKFKGGSFKAAMKAKCPIVPVALIDSYKAFDTGSAKMLDVQIHFLKPMEYEEYKDMKSTEIAAEVKRRIEETIRENARDF